MENLTQSKKKNPHKEYKKKIRIKKLEKQLKSNIAKRKKSIKNSNG